MTKLVFTDSSIECIAASIITRKIMPGAFVHFTNIGRCITYKCSRNSEAIILKELDPKKALVNKFSKLDVGTKLECDKLYVAIKRVKPYNMSLINHSGRHKAQTFDTTEFTYARITTQIQGIKECIPPVSFELIK